MDASLVRRTIRDGRDVVEYQLRPGEMMDGLVLKSCKENRVSGVLQMGAVYEDGHNYMYSYVDKKETLKNQISDVVTQKVLLTAFESIVAALDGLVEQEINLGYIVLDTECIYIDSETGKARLICVPIRQAEDITTQLPGFFRNILANSVYLNSEDGDYVAKLLSAVNREFELKSFLRTIRGLMRDAGIEIKEDTVQETSIEAAGQATEGTTAEEQVTEQPENVPQVIEEVTAQSEEEAEKAAQPAEKVAEEAGQPAEKATEEEAQPVEEEAEKAAQPVEEEADKAAQPVEEEAEKAAQPVEKVAEEAEQPVEEEAEKAIQPVEEEAEKAAQSVEKVTEEAEQPVKEAIEEVVREAEKSAAEELEQVAENTEELPQSREEITGQTKEAVEQPIENADRQAEQKAVLEPLRENVTEKEQEKATAEPLDKVVEHIEEVEQGSQVQPIVAEPITQGSQIQPEVAEPVVQEPQIQPVAVETATQGPQIQPVAVETATQGPQIQPVAVETVSQGPQVQPVALEVVEQGLQIQPVAVEAATQEPQVQPVGAVAQESQIQTAAADPVAQGTQVQSVVSAVPHAAHVGVVPMDDIEFEPMPEELNAKIHRMNIHAQQEPQPQMVQNVYQQETSYVQPIGGPKPMYRPEDVGLAPEPEIQQTMQGIYQQTPQQPMQGSYQQMPQQQQIQGTNQQIPQQPVQGQPQPPMQQKPTPHLVRVKTGELIYLPEDDFTIGKAPRGVSYRIEDNSAVSRIHCTIRKKGGAYFVRDENSTNSTFVNGEKVLPNTEHILTNNCKLVLGDEEFTYLLW